MNKILLIGSTGQVGQELLTTLVPLGEIIAPTKHELDLTSPQAIAKSITTWQPNIIVNAAAYTAVDLAEQESDLAMTVNAEAVKVIALVAQQLEALLVHISTDYVFAGDACIPYLETDQTQPLGVYGRSKLRGEQAISQNCEHYLIVRTAWVYGSKGKSNFVKTMLRLGAERTELKVVADQIGSPTWAYDLSEAIAKLIRLKTQNLSDPKISSGIYHFTNSGVASWYDFAQAIFTEAKQLGFPLKVTRVIPIPSQDYPTPAQRPVYSVLAKEKYSAIVDYPPYWRNSLRTMLTELLTEQQRLSALKSTTQFKSLTKN